jgi:very-short-patch-repair endonuclease
MTRTRQLRESGTQHERLLWRHPRNRQLQGWKFRQQHPVDRYIIDFYCPEVRLAIELDGGGRNFANRESLDQKRTRFLASKNILVLRFGAIRSTGNWGESRRLSGIRILANRFVRLKKAQKLLT